MQRKTIDPVGAACAKLELSEEAVFWLGFLYAGQTGKRPKAIALAGVYNEHRAQFGVDSAWYDVPEEVKSFIIDVLANRVRRDFQVKLTQIRERRVHEKSVDS